MRLPKSELNKKAERSLRFGHQCANGKRGDKSYRINAAMCYSLCIQIVGDKRLNGAARDLVLAAFALRDAEVNPGLK